jgi:Na+-transporting NADH:ubiquinone oxidoreductase subunit A
MREKVITLRQGFDIRLLGKPGAERLEPGPPALYALKPTDLHGLAPIPKLAVAEADEVQAGQPLFFDKSRPSVRFCAPVSGEIVEIRRGARRAVTEVVILGDSRIAFREFSALDPESGSRESIAQRMMESGVWALIRQRPFNLVADPEVVPRDVFVSCFDTAPLAGDANVLIEGSEEAFLMGLRVLGRLTDGEVHLSVRPDSANVFRKADQAQVHTFLGPHPCGNVGVQIHHIRPISRGEVVWTLKPQDVAVVGRLFLDGIFDARRRVALAGAELRRTGYVDTRIGASVGPMLENNLIGDNAHVRVISGNVLTGRQVSRDGFLGLFDDHVTVIEENDTPEFMGWLAPSYARPSASRAFLSSFRGGLLFRANSNEHGELRAFVMSGEYERVLPMDIYPQQLIKSILYRDIEQMEGLGIYEVVEEDLALCEFVCTSKQPVQRILREGLDLARLEA